jgi:hypothetical protein
MADVELAGLSRVDLLIYRIELDGHIAACCGALDGTCRQLVRLGEVQFLLGGGRDAAPDH